MCRYNVGRDVERWKGGKRESVKLKNLELRTDNNRNKTASIGKGMATGQVEAHKQRCETVGQRCIRIHGNVITQRYKHRDRDRENRRKKTPNGRKERQWKRFNHTHWSVSNARQAVLSKNSAAEETRTYSMTPTNRHREWHTEAYADKQQLIYPTRISTACMIDRLTCEVNRTGYCTVDINFFSVTFADYESRNASLLIMHLTGDDIPLDSLQVDYRRDAIRAMSPDKQTDWQP